VNKFQTTTDLFVTAAQLVALFYILPRANKKIWKLRPRNNIMKNYKPVDQLEMTSVLVQFPDQNSAIVANADQLQTIAVEHRHI
jgi:hypothetical protein